MSAMDYYKVFYHAVKEGSITKAAQQLFITQPSASYAIKQLEDQLGVRLFIRQAKGVMLTEEGKALYHFVEQSYLLLQAGERKITEMRTYHAGIVRLGASDSLCKYYLLPFLIKFRREHPGIRILLSHGKSEDISSRLQQGTIDCGVVHLPAASQQVQVQAVKPIQECFLAAPEIVSLLGSTSLSLGELLQHPFVMLSEQSRTRAFFNAYLHTYGYTLTPDMEVGSVDLLLEFARRGLGISFITRDFASQDLQSGSLVELTTTAQPIPPRSIGVITQPDRTLSLAASYFVQALAIMMKAQAH
ncbi:MAG: LysR family transcriptional regulator [Paenibacillus sp.]|jgi:DNA-binding transcriptional LysR family regulator|nr:LysR family transcriptional regulator [Paenibacillus sp.]